MYHDSFWLAVAAAAPIIALANTVSMFDAVGVWHDSQAHRLLSVRIKMRYYGIHFVSALNLVFQAIAMYSALEHLLVEKDILSSKDAFFLLQWMPDQIAFILFIGLLYVLATVLGDIRLRSDLRRVAAEEKSKSEPPRHPKSGLGWPTVPPSS